MSHEFDGLDPTEKAGIEAALNRCRALASKIANELRNKRPVHFYQVAYFDRREVRIHWAERPPGRLPLSARKFRRPPE